jgi:hypothetical protein
MTTASQIFELLAADHRRQVLFLLCGTESLDVPEGLVTRGGAKAQQSGSGRSPSPPVRDSGASDRPVQQLDMELRHVHLPKLEAEDVIEWDSEAGTVSRGPSFEEIEPALRFLASNPVAFPDDLL